MKAMHTLPNVTMSQANVKCVTLYLNASVDIHIKSNCMRNVWNQSIFACGFASGEGSYTEAIDIYVYMRLTRCELSKYICADITRLAKNVQNEKAMPNVGIQMAEWLL